MLRGGEEGEDPSLPVVMRSDDEAYEIWDERWADLVLVGGTGQAMTKMGEDGSPGRMGRLEIYDAG